MIIGDRGLQLGRGWQPAGRQAAQLETQHIKQQRRTRGDRGHDVGPDGVGEQRGAPGEHVLTPQPGVRPVIKPGSRADLGKDCPGGCGNIAVPGVTGDLAQRGIVLAAPEKLDQTGKVGIGQPVYSGAAPIGEPAQQRVHVRWRGGFSIHWRQRRAKG